MECSALVSSSSPLSGWLRGFCIGGSFDEGHFAAAAVGGGVVGTLAVCALSFFALFAGPLARWRGLS